MIAAKERRSKKHIVLVSGASARAKAKAGIEEYRKHRLTVLLRRLNSAIEPLNQFIATEALSREDKRFMLSLLSTLNIQRDMLESMKNPLSDKDLMLVSEHLFQKSQSSFSD